MVQQAERSASGWAASWRPVMMETFRILNSSFSLISVILMSHVTLVFSLQHVAFSQES